MIQLLKFYKTLFWSPLESECLETTLNKISLYFNFQLLHYEQIYKSDNDNDLCIRLKFKVYFHFS